MERSLLAGTALAALVIASAQAADIPLKAPIAAPPVSNWSGFYGGIHGGWGWGSADYAFPAPSLTGFFVPAGGGAFSQNIDGALFGGHIGHNWQSGNWLFGLESSFAWVGFKSSSTDVFAPAVDSPSTYTTKLRWLATFTPRLGFVGGNWLIYGKGGLAVGEVESNLSGTRNPVTPPPFPFRELNDHIGWTAGVGVEHALTPNWIVGLEYNYVDLGRQQNGGFSNNTLTNVPVHYNIDLTFSTVVGRLSYKVSNPGVAPGAIPTKAPIYRGGSWSGLYVGIHGGGGWGDVNYRFPTGVGGIFWPAPDGGAFRQDISGGVFGGHLGFNYQSGNWVFGLEGGAAWSNVRGDATNVFAPAVTPTVTYNTRLNWLATVTSRIGYDLGSWLIYAKGGLAAGELESNFTTTAFAPPLTFRDKEAHVGFTVGGGLEYALATTWVVGVEYSYFDLGTQRHGGFAYQGAIPFTAVDSNADVRFSTVLARLSYKMGSLGSR